MVVAAALAIAVLIAASMLPAGAQSLPPTSVPPPTDPVTTAPPSTEVPTVITTVPESSSVIPTVFTTTTSTTVPAHPTTVDPGTGLPGPVPSSTVPTSTPVSVPPLPGTNPTGDPAAAGDAPSEAVPNNNFVVPPLPGTPILNNAFGPSRVILGALSDAQAALAGAQKIHDAAAARVQELQLQLITFKSSAPKLTRHETTQVAEIAKLQERVADATVEAYMGADVTDDASVLLGSADATDFSKRKTYASSLLDSMRDSVKRLRKVRKAAPPKVVKRAESQASLTLALAAATQIRDQSQLGLLTAGYAVQAFAAGSKIFVTGFVFPEGDPHNFVDSFGAPRLAGTPQFHYHEGIDLMAAAGTPEFACERGIITKISQSSLGGNGFWLKGQSGTSYYYAHLESYAPGMVVGKVIDAGTTIGYVGSTGDAQASAPHLHFEIHPNGGPAVDPYPMLKIIDDLNHHRTPTIDTVPH